MVKKKKSWLEALASLELTLFCLLLMMVLVLFGTLAQVRMGTYVAQKLFFNRFLIFTDIGGIPIPVFPGGLSVGLLWLVNLVAAFIVRFRWERKSAGVLIAHAGLVLLVAGQGLTQLSSRETMMPLQIGESRNYAESPQETELVLIDTTPKAYDEVTSIPYSRFNHEGVIHPPRLPFSLVVHAFYPNAALTMASADAAPLASQGIGTRVAVQPQPPVSSDDETNNATAVIEVIDGSQSLGTWLVSTGLGAPQSFTVQGHDYRIALRPRRTYFPFTLRLNDFRHDIYPGTDIAKNFSSRVRLLNPEKHESRDALIYMNHPLRYDGVTFYQASFGEGDRLSVLQVVQNPVAVTPYVSCAMVAVGLAMQFVSHLAEFLRKRA